MTAVPAGRGLFELASGPDPYPAYERLRARGPLSWSGDLDAWLTCSYDLTRGILRGPGWSSDPRTDPDLARRLGIPAPALELLSRVLLFMDAPGHARVRRLVTGPFTARAVETLQPRVSALVEELLDGVGDHREADLVAELAFPLPVAVICALMDLDAEGAELVWTETPKLAALVELRPTPDGLALAAGALMGVSLYLLPLIVQRREQPGDDLLSVLANAVAGGDRLGIDEVLNLCVLLLTAGHETTTNLIGSGILALLHHPDQLARLRAEPTLVTAAVEELLRYDSPVQIAGRVAAVDHELAGQRIDRGQQVFAILGAANRDPARFDHPNRLDITRHDPQHLSFGGGPHFCLGAALARLEAAEALTRLLRRFPHLAVADEPLRWRPTTTLRGLDALPVRLHEPACPHGTGR